MKEFLPSAFNGDAGGIWPYETVALGSQEGKIGMGCALQGLWACVMMDSCILGPEGFLYSPKAAWERVCPEKMKKKERNSPSKNAWYNPTGKQFDNLFQKHIPSNTTLRELTWEKLRLSFAPKNSTGIINHQYPFSLWVENKANCFGWVFG